MLRHARCCSRPAPLRCGSSLLYEDLVGSAATSVETELAWRERGNHAPLLPRSYVHIHGEEDSADGGLSSVVGDDSAVVIIARLAAVWSSFDALRVGDFVSEQQDRRRVSCESHVVMCVHRCVQHTGQTTHPFSRCPTRA